MAKGKDGVHPLCPCFLLINPSLCLSSLVHSAERDGVSPGISGIAVRTHQCCRLQVRAGIRGVARLSLCWLPTLAPRLPQFLSKMHRFFP